MSILSPRDANGVAMPEVEEVVNRDKEAPGVAAAVANLDKTIQALAEKSIASSRVMSASEMLENNQEATEGTLEDKEIMEQVLADQKAEEEGPADEEEDEEELEPMISAAKGMRYLRDLSRLFDAQEGSESRDASRLIPRLLRRLNRVSDEAKEQKKVTDYFVEWPKSP